MKVLFVSSGNLKTGISPIVRSQGESLKRNGIDLDYFTIVGKGATGYIKNIARLRKFLENKNYDIIHAHYGLCGIVSELSRKTEKLVVSFMGDDLIGSNNNDGSYTMKSKLIVGANKYFALKRYDSNIVKSKELGKIINAARNRRIISNGVDFKTFFPMGKEVSREILGTNKKQRIVLFVATNPKRKEKNFALAKKACEMIKGINVSLIPLHGVNQKILNLHYNAADVVLLTSYHEGSPNVIKEAMACDCPIVSTDVGDVKEVIGNTDGCYISSFDPEEVVEKLRMAIKFGSTTRGRDRLIQLGLDSTTIANKIINVYQQVLEIE
jgi:teichuronic acid biosynthesis glycosyltransferase TuaC